MSKKPLIVTCGLGSNSTAVLVGYQERGIIPDHIIFADTGGERPETYEYKYILSAWLVKHGMPAVETIKTDLPPLYENCIKNKELPSVVYGRKSCSDKWKTRPMNKALRIKGYDNVVKVIGIDADEAHRAGESQRKWIKHIYPLLDWDWGRDECIEAINRAGLPQPGKSSCYFCPNMHGTEVRKLNHDYPDLAKKACFMEKNASLTEIKGLGRSWSWTEMLKIDDMFSEDYKQFSGTDCGCHDG